MDIVEQSYELIGNDHMDTVTSEDLAYIAGFFDGEGCIIISMGKDYNRIETTVCNTKDITLYWLQSIFGGCVSKRISKNPKRKDVYVWATVSRVAGRFLSIIQPYLKLKYEQAELALEFQRSQGRPNGKYTPEKVEYRGFLFDRLKELNSKGKNGQGNGKFSKEVGNGMEH